jgi:deoxyadenosine/deoxycytidine kinase
MKSFLIGVVGPCAAGKTTLVQNLRHLGYQAKPIAQEHSYVANMWQRLTAPEVLVYLGVSYPLTMDRRKLDWTFEEYSEQLHRLRHARQHADLTVDTDPLTPDEVLARVLSYLETFNSR